MSCSSTQKHVLCEWCLMLFKLWWNAPKVAHIVFECQLQKHCVVMHMICVIGNRKTPLAKVTDSGEDESSLFIFSFSECSMMDLYRVKRPAVAEKETRATLSGLEEACNFYFQERFVKCSVLNDWTKNNFMCVHNWKKFSLRTFSPHESKNTGTQLVNETLCETALQPIHQM